MVIESICIWRPMHVSEFRCFPTGMVCLGLLQKQIVYVTSFWELYETSPYFPIQGNSIQMSRRISQSRETRSFLESVFCSWRCLDKLRELDLWLVVISPTIQEAFFPHSFFHFVLRPHGAVWRRNMAISAKFMA